VLVCSYHCADNSVQDDGAELIEERARRHEVSSVDDDRRQKNEKERTSVELVVLNVLGVGQVQRYTNDNSEHYQ